MRALSEAIGTLTPEECEALVRRLLRTAAPGHPNTLALERLRDPAIANNVRNCELYDRVLLIHSRTVILIDVTPTEVRRSLARWRTKAYNTGYPT